MAGLISDYTNGRATTCCVMLILAAPMVGTTSRAECTCSNIPVQAVEMHAHLGTCAHACVCVCMCVCPSLCLLGAEKPREAQERDSD